jgi:hypothetical protein
MTDSHPWQPLEAFGRLGQMKLGETDREGNRKLRDVAAALAASADQEDRS